jgi:[ribosomal protein S5]-alanine N-acetyltransferase
MFWSRFGGRKNITIQDAAGAILLRRPELRDYPAWNELRRTSADFLTPWEPRWPADDMSWAGYRRRMKIYRRELETGTGLTFFIFLACDKRLIGGLSFTNIRYGSSCNCQLGYWMGKPYSGKGYMKTAVRTALEMLFSNTSIERVEAVCLPGNAPSEGLLRRLGFRKEGELRQYMEINGERRDHLLYAILKSEFFELLNKQDAEKSMAQEKRTNPAVEPVNDKSA